jgi:hypothetical protein
LTCTDPLERLLNIWKIKEVINHIFRPHDRTIGNYQVIGESLPDPTALAEHTLKVGSFTRAFLAAAVSGKVSVSKKHEKLLANWIEIHKRRNPASENLRGAIFSYFILLFAQQMQLDSIPPPFSKDMLLL